MALVEFLAAFPVRSHFGQTEASAFSSGGLRYKPEPWGKDGRGDPSACISWKSLLNTWSARLIKAIKVAKTWRAKIVVARPPLRAVP